MKKDIVASIIKGKNITGDDIGKLLIADMAEEFLHYKETNELKSIITQDEFNKLLNSLPSEAQIKRYNNYVNLHNTIRTYYGLHQYALQTAKYRLGVFNQILNNITGAIERQIQEDNTPLIMTEDQYNRAIKECEKDLNKYPFNYYSVFFHAVSMYTYNPDAEIKTLLDRYKSEKVKSKEVRDAYYKGFYHTGPDGYFRFNDYWEIGKTRSEFIKELSIRNITPLKDKLKKYTAKELNKPVDECFIFDVLTPEQIDKHLTYELYDTPPEDVYKDDIIGGELITDEYDIDTEDKAEQKEILHLYRLYEKEIPELVDLIKNRLKKYKCLKGMLTASPEDAFNSKVDWDSLAKEDVLDYKSWAIRNFEGDNKRAENGIAILKRIPDNRGIVDAQGNYVDHSKDLTYLNNVQDAYKQAFIEGDNNNNMQYSFYENLTLVYAHNTFIEIVADMLGLPNLKQAFCFDTGDIEKDVDAFNFQLQVLLTTHLQSYARGGRYDEARTLRDNIFKAMPYIDVDKAKTKETSRAMGKKYIEDLNNFKGISATSQPLYILTGENVWTI